MAEEEEKDRGQRTEDSADAEAAPEAAAEEQGAGSEERGAPEAEAPAEGEAPEEAAGEDAAEADDAGGDAGEAAPAAGAGEDEEPVAELTPKQRRKLARSTHTGEAGPELSTEERVDRRRAERERKAAARRRYRKGRGAARAKAAGKGSGTGTAPTVGEPGNPKVRQGIVVSDRMDKTITVRVESARRHPSYEKVIRTSKMYHAHDERNEAGAGDTVRLVETRPMSKTKRWRLTEILEKAK
jgi:small subunit ribosomal protein S17